MDQQMRRHRLLQKAIKGLIAALLLLPVVGVQAQTERIANQYPFLYLEKNELQYFGDSSRFTHFFDRLDTLLFEGRGKINILHMGGSHVQAGTLSNALREHFLSLSPGLKGERGFFFPYKLARTNNPFNYRVSTTGKWEGCRCSVPKMDCPWGVSGINATTYDSTAQVKLYARDADRNNYFFDAVRIYHHQDSDSYELSMDADYNITSCREDTVANYTEFTFGQQYDTLQFSLTKVDSIESQFTIQGIQYMLDQPGLVYHSIGVNGASTASYLRANNFTNQLASFPPDLVIFGIGINDSYMPESAFNQRVFESRYEEIIAQIRSVNPKAAFLFLTNNDSYYRRRYPNRNVFKITDGMVNVAKRNDAAMWDLFGVMGGLNAIRTWEEYQIAKKDKIHFTPKGYRLQADLLFEAIKKAYSQHLSATYSTKEP